jgi:hypothetical protein
MNAFRRAALIAAALLFASPASAAVMVVTYSGLASGTDGLNMFGGGTLSAVPFSFSFTYDTARGFRETGPTGDALSTPIGGDPPVVRVDYELNGVTGSQTTFSLATVATNLIANVFTVNPHQASFDSFGRVAMHNEFTMGVTLPAAPSTLETPFSLDGGLGGSLASWVRTDYTSPDSADEFTNVVTVFQLGVAHIDLVALDGTPVPEPGVWTVMILGFGAAGAALRRSRRLALAA